MNAFIWDIWPKRVEADRRHTASQCKPSKLTERHICRHPTATCRAVLKRSRHQRVRRKSHHGYCPSFTFHSQRIHSLNMPLVLTTAPRSSRPHGAYRCSISCMPATKPSIVSLNTSMSAARQTRQARRQKAPESLAQKQRPYYDGHWRSTLSPCRHSARPSAEDCWCSLRQSASTRMVSTGGAHTAIATTTTV